MLPLWHRRQAPQAAAGGPENQRIAGERGSRGAVQRRGGAVNVVDSINHMFLMSRMIVPGSTYWNFGVGRERQDVANDEEAIQNMHDLGETIAWLIKGLCHA